jgi:hypothetical protein
LDHFTAYLLSSNQEDLIISRLIRESDFDEDASWMMRMVFESITEHQLEFWIVEDLCLKLEIDISYVVAKPD